MSNLWAQLPAVVHECLHDNRPEEAIRILEPLAAEKNSEAQNTLGEIYHFCKKVQDYTKAKAWYEKAAHNGNGVAANHLGRIYLNGEGVSVDKKRALFWYKKGMELGDISAEINYYYFQQNPFSYILQQALKGDRDAQRAASQFYKQGRVTIVKSERKSKQYSSLSR